MNAPLVIAGVACTVVAFALYVSLKLKTVDSALQEPESSGTEVGHFVNDKYDTIAPESFGTNQATVSPNPAPSNPLPNQAAEFLGTMLVGRTSVLAGVTVIGQVADFANTGVRNNTESLMKDAGMQRELQQFEQRQCGYDMVSGRIDETLLKGTSEVLKGQPPIIQSLGKGVALGVGDLVNAPVEVAALLDSAISGQVTKFQTGNDLQKAMVVVGFKDAIISGIVFDGIGGGLVDMIAKTPEEKAKGQEVLDMLNPSKQIDRAVELLVPAVQASLAETTARLAREKAERDAAAKALADKLAAEQKARDAAAAALSAKLAAEQKARDAAFQASLKETADRLAREKTARDAAARALSDRLAAEQRARDAAFQASLRATADRLAREKRERDDRLAREKRERDDKARADAQKRADDLKKSNDKAKADLNKIGNAFKNAFTPKKKK
jgi:hypothetical protein